MAEEAVMERTDVKSRADELDGIGGDDPASSTGEQRGRRKRLQIELSEVAFQRLNELVLESKAESVADFARSAIRFYAFFLEHKRRGYKLMLAKDVKDFEVLEL